MASAKLRANEQKVSMMSNEEILRYAKGEKGKVRAKARKEADRRGLNYA